MTLILLEIIPELKEAHNLDSLAWERTKQESSGLSGSHQGSEEGLFLLMLPHTKGLAAVLPRPYLEVRREKSVFKSRTKLWREQAAGTLGSQQRNLLLQTLPGRILHKHHQRLRPGECFSLSKALWWPNMNLVLGHGVSTVPALSSPPL